MGCVVVAEGVESAAQAALLAELGCRFAQGYHFYRPMPLAELLSLLGTP
jgi:EAL domain-containing protein (putative c-di-GMP-specific phosphodiesterase class I)